MIGKDPRGNKTKRSRTKEPVTETAVSSSGRRKVVKRGLRQKYEAERKGQCELEAAVSGSEKDDSGSRDAAQIKPRMKKDRLAKKLGYEIL